jgi:hypothetical protein
MSSRRRIPLHSRPGGGIHPAAGLFHRPSPRCVPSEGRAQAEPEQWAPADPGGGPCLFCGDPARTGPGSAGVWDHDELNGWQVMAFHLGCTSPAESQPGAGGFSE